jgi:hypothetical protein
VRVIRTELRREREDAFVIRTDETDLQAVLPTLAYAQEADGKFIRRFPRNKLTPSIYERFSASVPALLAHTARREAPPWENSLEHLHHLLAGANIEWMLGGSAALAIRGVKVIPRDIDFTVADQQATARALDHLLIEPPLKSNGRWIAEWFGRAWDGTRIEWAAETRPDLDDHDWTSDIGPDAERRAETVEWRGRCFRVPPLDLQAAVSRERGLHERTAAIALIQASRP